MNALSLSVFSYLPIKNIETSIAYYFEIILTIKSFIFSILSDEYLCYRSVLFITDLV